jgi:hypothetical protein
VEKNTDKFASLCCSRYIRSDFPHNHDLVLNPLNNRRLYSTGSISMLYFQLTFSGTKQLLYCCEHHWSPCIHYGNYKFSTCYVTNASRFIPLSRCVTATNSTYIFLDLSNKYTTSLKNICSLLLQCYLVCFSCFLFPSLGSHCRMGHP